jgi:hypothetical protein
MESGQVMYSGLVTYIIQLYDTLKANRELQGMKEA